MFHRGITYKMSINFYTSAGGALHGVMTPMKGWCEKYDVLRLHCIPLSFCKYDFRTIGYKTMLPLKEGCQKRVMGAMKYGRGRII